MFHHYYIYGQLADCSEHKKRVKNCIKWRTGNSEEAKVGGVMCIPHRDIIPYRIGILYRDESINKIL